ncbi:MAG TPA: type II toxin-antitoxin system RelE/ParE family toxin [Candidatus Tumulicola sp.]|nr:type II toxin-antitoxin system RelE/ParE family toxin [Candidatus Tumulicola sp.]
MAQVVYSDDAFADFERIVEFLLEQGRDDAARALTQIRSAISLLEVHPLIGHRVAGELRALVISYGRSGYLAVYRFEAAPDVVRILRIRHQREAGYRD